VSRPELNNGLESRRFKVIIFVTSIKRNWYHRPINWLLLTMWMPQPFRNHFPFQCATRLWLDTAL